MTDSRPAPAPGSASRTSPTLDAANPFAAPSALPYELPDFAAIRAEHYAPAIRAGMADQLAEVAAIVATPEPPTAENTLDALEASGRVLTRAATVLFNRIGADASPELEDIEEELAPELAAHHDAIFLDPALHARLRALADRAASGAVALDAQAAFLLDELLKDFRRAGIDLPAADQDALRALNARETTLRSSFGRRLLAGANAASVLLTDPDELAGLSSDVVAGAARAAADRGIEGDGRGAWLIEMQLPTQQSVLASLERRDVRERVQRASESRGASGGDTDTRETLLEIVRARAEKARLLGYAHYADFAAERGTARTGGAVAQMLARLAPPAVANARAEASDLEAALRAAEPGAHLEPWDWAYFSERVRTERFALDDAALRPYLELERVVHDGVFRAAHLLYGLSFVERADLKGYRPSVRVFEVFDGEPGLPDSGLGLFVADWYTRESKRGGAWMNNLVDQSHLLDQRPVVVNNLNIVAPPPGEPTLLSWDNVRTLFHEFGHALHGLFADTRYPSRSGTSVPRDFVEYPSQVNEMWMWDPETLRAFAVHHVTGEPLPGELFDTLLATQAWGEGFGTTEYLAAAILDQAWHRLTPDEVPTDPEQVTNFEQRALADAGIDYAPVPPRYRSTYYNHVFGGGYAAGYYSYIWAEVLDADTVEWFRENGGLRRENGDRFRSVLLAPGGSSDAMAAFEALRGRGPDIAPLLVRRGLS